ncbi:MAG: hypothetical protein KDA61_06675 [Planctomycetales bacterium]|nr:hypothetical protein [Planctomycetales bacterium]
MNLEPLCETPLAPTRLDHMPLNDWPTHCLAIASAIATHYLADEIPPSEVLAP